MATGTEGKPSYPGAVSELYGHVGEALRRARNLRMLSLREVEEMSNGRFRHISVAAYERGYRRPPLHVLVELCEFYGVPAATLLPEEGEAMVPLGAVIASLTQLFDSGALDAVSAPGMAS